MDGEEGDVILRVKPAVERSVSAVSNDTTATSSELADPLVLTSGAEGEADTSVVEPRRAPRTKEEIELSNLKKKTRKRTRRFEVDGVVVTTTTNKVCFLMYFTHNIIASGFWH